MWGAGTLVHTVLIVFLDVIYVHMLDIKFTLQHTVFS